MSTFLFLTCNDYCQLSTRRPLILHFLIIRVNCRPVDRRPFDMRIVNCRPVDRRPLVFNCYDYCQLSTVDHLPVASLDTNLYFCLWYIFYRTCFYMIFYDLCSAYESYSAHENITGTTYPYITVEPILSPWLTCLPSLIKKSTTVKSLLCSQAYFHRCPLWPWPLTSDLQNQ